MALTLLHSDNFNRSNAGLNGATMSDGVGTWADVSGAGSGAAVVGNQAVMGTSSGAPNFVCFVVDSAMDVATTDQRADQVTQGTDGGPLARCSDGSNAYYAYRGGTFVDLYKIVAGTSSYLGSTGPGAVANGDTVALECVGTTIRILVNSVQKLSVTDSSLTAGRAGGYGGGSAAHAWDDFAVYTEPAAGGGVPRIVHHRKQQGAA